MLSLTSAGYKLMGFNRGVGVAAYEGKPGIWYREWAPGAKVGKERKQGFSENTHLSGSGAWHCDTECQFHWHVFPSIESDAVSHSPGDESTYGGVFMTLRWQKGPPYLCIT
eukprot:scaffold7249_cov19-Tisochrysis_lutea.AAC.3